jgi:hypothetical protein
LKKLNSPQQKDVDETYRICQAMQESDLAFLEEYARMNPPFPDGLDRWLDRSWLCHAIGEGGSIESIAWVLSHVADVNHVSEEETNAMSAALNRGSDEVLVMRMLVDAGADIHATGCLNETILHYAAMRGRKDVVQFLLDCGADPHLKDAERGPKSSIEYARFWKHEEVAVLMENYKPT